jgi:hypothetical protein
MQKQNDSMNTIRRVPVLCALTGFLISFLWIMPAKADVVISSGAKVRIMSGNNLISGENVLIKDGGVLTVEGSLILKKNLTNQNANEDFGLGTVEISGTIAQNLSGQNTIGNLKLNNPEGLDISGNTIINGVLTLENGHFRIGNSNLTLGISATVKGSPSSNSMVITSGTGEMRKSFSIAESFTWPLGKNTGTPEYLPVTINFTSGDFLPGNYLGVKITNSAYPGYTNNCLNRYWSINQDGISGFQYDAVFQYSPDDIIGNENSISCVQVMPVPSTVYDKANILLHQLTASGLSKFGNFTGISAIKSAINVYLEASFNSTTNLVETKLSDASRIPNSQPFNTIRLNYTGSETVFSVPSNVVDWVLVELRQATSPELATSSTILAKRAAFLKKDGSIVDLDGTSPLQFINSAVSSGNSVYVVVRHRNHLAVMSASGAILNNGVYSYDFTTGLSQAYGGGNGYKQIGSKFLMVSGDIDQDGSIFVSDYNQWAVGFGATNGYFNSDLDMDGDIFVSDYNKWAVNFGSTDNSLLKSAQSESKYFSCVPK